MSNRKRKRFSRDLKCVFFPDDVEGGLLKTPREPPSLSCVSSAKSWERCGDSFLETLRSSCRKLSDVRRLAQSTALEDTSADDCKEDAAHIAWSSSDSDQCDAETLEQKQAPKKPTRPTSLNQSHIRALYTPATEKDDLPVIDTDSELEKSEDEVEKHSGAQISDCESEPIDEKSEDLSQTKHENIEELEIPGCMSDGETVSGTAASSRLDSESFFLQTGESSRRSVGDWVRSAQAMLQTPQKPLNRQPKTPEDSAKKKRKFQSGGLAERLSRLQSRQRSAVSFWRHQSTSDSSTATVDRPGKLVLEVLEVQEESSMQLALCERQEAPGEGHQHSEPVPEERARVLVLFNRETAAQLIPAPRDIIHIYPPWQSLSIEGFSCDVILNTFFSQKVLSASKPETISAPGGLFSAGGCRPYPLCQTFGLLQVGRTSEENNTKQGSSSDVLCDLGGSGGLMRHCLSLLEAVEGLGQAGSVGQDVEVVVQRVYSIPVPNPSTVSVLKPRVLLRSSSAAPPAEKGRTRLCMLVQDCYGMFSEVQLHLLPRRDDLQHYIHIWQGRTCMLRGIKVVQRVTRERRSRLFSLIDSLWPPVIPLKDLRNTPSTSTECKPAGPAPSFCYLLSGQESSIETIKEKTVSQLYLPNTFKTLRDILQSEVKTSRCTFAATVIYKRITESSDAGQGEVWLVLTDPSLQEELHERPCRRTVSLCVSTSCVLTSSVFKSLNSPTACRLSFRDTIKEQGVFLCVEQSVIEICSEDPKDDLEPSSARPESLTQSVSEPRAKTLPQPVRLDPLSPELTPNSLCSLTGVIVGVDENTAYSWPACSHCGSDNLEKYSETNQNFHCVSCKSDVDKPNMKIQLEVFLSSSLSNCTVKVKLQQETIMSILNMAALESREFLGYDVENVLGKEVGPLAAYVRVVTRKPALWIGLEEISL